MAGERMSLSWNKFSETAERAFRDLGSSGDFSDVTLAGADGKLVEAHKVILSTCSPVRKTVLIKISNSHPCLYMKGMSFEDINLLLKFVYTGEVTLEKENLDSFLENANELQIAGLTKISEPGEDIAEYNVVTDQGKMEDEAFKTEKEKEHFKRETEFEFSPKEISSSPQRIVCDHPGCEKEFSTKAILRTHKSAIHEKVTHSCQFCSYKTGFPGNLKRHNQTAHKDDQNLSNSKEIQEEAHYEQIFQSAESLGSEENGTEIKSNLCRECGKEFASSQNLSIHKQAVHELVKYPCDECDHKSTNKSNLKSHMKRKHTT